MKQKTMGHKVGLEYVFIPGGFQLEYKNITLAYPDPDCNLVFLDDRMIMLLLSLTPLLKWQWLWGLPPRSQWTATEIDLWDDISAFVAETEKQLMTACSTNGIVQQLALLRGAISGEVIDLDNIPETGVFDYSATGVIPILSAKMDDLEENSDQMEDIMDSVNIILGAAAILA